MKICPKCQRCYEDADAVCAYDATRLVGSRHGSRLITDKYRLDSLLGRGGMGAVYAGSHVDLDRPVAIKLLLPDFTADQDARERFRREARAAAKLNHPNVADTYDYGTLPDDGAYIVMELVEGQTLRDYMDACGALGFAEACDIARQACDGVEAAHQRGIVHRDLKPSNIILTQDHHNRLLIKVVDFGVAKLREQTTTSGALTASGSIIGTPRYMAPEQCSGHNADARSDIYSLAVILYEMIANRPPFDAPTATAIAIKHIQEPPPPIQQFRKDVPAALAALIMQALAKDPAQRPQTAAEFSAKLNEIGRALPATAFHPLPGERTTLRSFDPRTQEFNAPVTIAHHAEAPQTTSRLGEPTGEHTSSAPAHERTDEQSAETTVVASDEATNKLQQASAATPPPTSERPASSTPSSFIPATASYASSDHQENERNRAALTTHIADAAPLKHSPDVADNASRYANLRTPAKSFSGVTTNDDTPAASTRKATYAYAALAIAIVLGTGTLTAWLVPRFNARRQAANDVAPHSLNDPANASSSPQTATTTTTVPAPSSARNATNTSNTDVMRPHESNAADATNSANRVSANMTARNPQDELRSLLGQWADATNARDVNRQMSFYAPTLERYYLRPNASNAFVRADKANHLAHTASSNVRLSDIAVNISDDGRTATMRYNIEWTFTGANAGSGAAIEELRWQKINNTWKIVSERDLRKLR